MSVSSSGLARLVTQGLGPFLGPPHLATSASWSGDRPAARLQTAARAFATLISADFQCLPRAFIWRSGESRQGKTGTGLTQSLPFPWARYLLLLLL